MKPHQEPASVKAAAAVAPVTGKTADAMRAATLQAEKQIALLLAAARKDAIPRADSRAWAAAGLPVTAGLLASYQAGGRYDSHLQVATLTVTLASLPVRDDAWARSDAAHQDAHLRLWTDVTRMAQPGYVAAPASLLAFTAWQGGKTALASAALDRARADDPEYSMAALIRIGLATAMPPSLARPRMTPDEVAAYYASAPEAALLTSARARAISGNGPRDPGRTGQPSQKRSLAARAQQQLAARSFPHGPVVSTRPGTGTETHSEQASQQEAVHLSKQDFPGMTQSGPDVGSVAAEPEPGMARPAATQRRDNQQPRRHP